MGGPESHVDRHPLPPRRRRSSTPTATPWSQRAPRRPASRGWCCRRWRWPTSTPCAHWRTGHGAAYALGIHPLYVDRAADGDLERLRQRCARTADDPRLVAVGEIGLDHFVPGLDRARQERFYVAQLSLAREAGLPVILHVRRSADALLKGLRRVGGARRHRARLQRQRGAGRGNSSRWASGSASAAR